MTKIECPNCKTPVDIDSPTVKKGERGLDLAVKCPGCGTDFMVARVALVREKLHVAEFGYTINEQGQEVRIQL